MKERNLKKSAESFQVTNSSFLPTLEYGDYIHVVHVTEYEGDGLYVVNTPYQGEDLMRVQQRIDGELCLTQDNVATFAEKLSLTKFSSMVRGKAVWVSKCIDTNHSDLIVMAEKK